MISKTLVTTESILAQIDALDAQSQAGLMHAQVIIVQQALCHPAIAHLLLSASVAAFTDDPDLIAASELIIRQSCFGFGIQIGIALAEARQMEELLSPCQS